MDGPLAVLHMYKMDFLKLKSTYHDLFQKEFPSHSNPFDSKCKDNPASKVETLGDAGLKRKPIVRQSYCKFHLSGQYPEGFILVQPSGHTNPPTT